VEVVKDTTSPAFYSHLFVVPKPGGRWRPVIDLSSLNKLIIAPHFRMETARSLRQSVLQGEFAVSLDLTDAYLHVPMYRATRRYLRFAIDGTVFAFRAMPFALNLSPWAFTRLMDAVMVVVRRQTSSQVSNYLDDILQKHTDPMVLRQDLAVLRELLQRLGWLVNEAKSDLSPSQEFQHLGMFFRTQHATVELTSKRRDKLLDAVRALQAKRFTSPREVAAVIGFCASAAELIPSGRLAVRPLQWALQDLWSQATQSWDVPIPVSQALHDALLPWTSLQWLSSAVPLSLPLPDISLCSDASLTGWGAHLLPSFETVHGVWSRQETQLHINFLEMLAAFRALQFWGDTLRGRSVMLLTDNTTVVAYIKNQGGTHSRQLCQLAIEVLQWCAAMPIFLHVRHIPGHLNVLADGLSRRRVFPTEWTLHDDVFALLHQSFPNMEIDLFATRFNHKLPLFVSPVPDPLALAMDGLSLDWNGRDLYAFPPFPLVTKVLAKMKSAQCDLTLITPLRWNRSSVTQLVSLLVDIPFLLPCRPDLLTQRDSSVLYPDLHLLSLHACRLSSVSSREKTSRLASWLASQATEGLEL